MDGSEEKGVNQVDEENALLSLKLEEVKQKTFETCHKQCWIMLQKAFGGVLLIDGISLTIIEDTDMLLDMIGRDLDDRLVGESFVDLIVNSGSEIDVFSLVNSVRELKFRKKDGSSLEVEVRAVRIPFGERPSICIAIQDITERKLLEKSLRHDASHDHLTGLPNRKSFLERIQQEIAYHARREKTLAIMVLDLDNFKLLNDSLGHRAGDIFLKEFASILRKSLREYDIVARYGGDEFLIGLMDVQSLENVAYVANKILRLFNSPIQVEEQSINYVSGSIGIAIYPKDGDDIDILLECADIALYLTKRKGRNGFSFCGNEG